LRLSFHLTLAVCVLAAAVLVSGCGGKKAAVTQNPKPTRVAQEAPKAEAPAPETSLPGLDQLAKSAKAQPPAIVNPAPAVGPETRSTASAFLVTLQNTYKGMATLRSVGSTVIVGKADGKVVGHRQKTVITMLFARPNKIAIDNDQTRLVIDGKTIYSYQPSVKRYIKDTLTKERLRSLVMSRPGISVLGLLFGVDYRPVIASSKLLADSRLGTREVHVLVIRLKTGVGTPKGMDVAETLWIGKQDLGLYKTVTVLSVRPKAAEDAKGKTPKLMEQTVTTTVTSFAPNVKFPASTFTFKPPAGVKLYEEPKPVDLTGKPAPDFSFQWIDGQTKKLSDFREKVVLLDFFALPMCDPQTPVLQSLSKKLKDGVQLIVFDLNINKANVLARLKQKGCNFPLVFADAASAKVASDGYKVMGLPTMFIIDEKGIIRECLMGVAPEKEIEAKLNKVIAH
jgi:peroxiredoxin/outer membrane lipoprotein-sorting protein